MVETAEESTHIWSHKIRCTRFLSAMRHFYVALRTSGWQVHYRSLHIENDSSLAAGLTAAISQFRPQRVIAAELGDMRVRDQIENAIESVATSPSNTGARGQKGLNLHWSGARTSTSCAACLNSENRRSRLASCGWGFSTAPCVGSIAC
ncbi:MAG: deoxyribodipyrimidine photolyase [Polaromonas sp.]|jgi:hypothetical protein|nr:deoxyribodipyrimidine photolyase [Polaromonas sp.]